MTTGNPIAARPVATSLLVGGLAAESRKLLSLPSTALTVLITAAVTALIGWNLAFANAGPPTAAELLVIGHNLAALGFLVLGVLAGTSEYAGGQLTTTLTAVPRRVLLVVTKVAALAGFATVTGAGVLAVLLAPSGAWPDGRLGGGLLVAALALASMTLLGAAVGLLLRQLVPALVVAIAVLTIAPVVLASFGLPIWWLPSDAAVAVVDAVTGATAWTARPALVVLAWVATLWAAAAAAFVRRDA